MNHLGKTVFVWGLKADLAECGSHVSVLGSSSE